MSKKEELKEELKKEDVLQRVLDREHDHRVMLEVIKYLWKKSKGDESYIAFLDVDPFFDDKLNNYLGFCIGSIDKLRKDSVSAVEVAANCAVEIYDLKEKIKILEERNGKIDDLKKKIYWLRDRLKKYEDPEETYKAEREV